MNLQLEINESGNLEAYGLYFNEEIITVNGKVSVTDNFNDYNYSRKLYIINGKPMVQSRGQLVELVAKKISVGSLEWAKLFIN